jgi:hypothetical protein
MCFVNDEGWQKYCGISEHTHQPVLYLFDLDRLFAAGQQAIVSRLVCPRFDAEQVRRRFDLLCSALPKTGNPKESREKLNLLLAGMEYRQGSMIEEMEPNQDITVRKSCAPILFIFLFLFIVLFAICFSC